MINSVGVPVRLSRPPVPNTKPDPGIQHKTGMAVGAAIGAATGAGGGFLAGGAIGAAIGGTIGLVAGGWAGKHHEAINFDARYTAILMRNLGSAAKGAVEDFFDRHHAHREPLTDSSLKARAPSGGMVRKFDGYDSSRNITGVYAKEEPQAYTFQVEMANLRAGAEHGKLDTTLLLNWGDPSGNTALPGGLQGTADAWEAAVQIDTNRHGKIVDANGNVVGKPQEAFHSTTFSTVEFAVDKGTLRTLGWKDGEPLRLQALTSKDGEPEVTDRLACTTQSTPSNVFRWDGKVVYYVVTDRFNNGDKTNDAGIDPKDPEKYHGGDWQGVIDKLDYIKGLGTDCIWISCPYLNDKNFFGKDGFHGYWPHDFQAPEPHFGDMAKLRELTDKAHAKGMKVMMDIVLNHTGYNHPFVTDPQYHDWFHRAGDLRGVDQYSMEHEALAGLPDLAQENPQVAKYLTDVHKWWVEQSGCDAFRMDAVRHIPESFLRDFDRTMHATKPNFYSVGESFWLDPNFDSGYQNRALDGTFDFPLAYAMRDVFASDAHRGFWDRVKLAKQFFMNNPNEAVREVLSPNGGSMLRLKLAMQEDRLYDNPKKLGTLVDNHDMIRFLSDCGGDTHKLQIALAFLMASRGVPCVYYGTEVGMEGTVDNRADMQFGKNPALTDAYRALTTARHASEALQNGSQKELLATHDTYGFARMAPSEEVVCVFNNGDTEKQIKVPLNRDSRIPDGTAVHDLIANGTATVSRHHLTVTLPPKGYGYYRWTA